MACGTQCGEVGTRSSCTIDKQMHKSHLCSWHRKERTSTWYSEHRDQESLEQWISFRRRLREYLPRLPNIFAQRFGGLISLDDFSLAARIDQIHYVHKLAREGLQSPDDVHNDEHGYICSTVRTLTFLHFLMLCGISSSVIPTVLHRSCQACKSATFRPKCSSNPVAAELAKNVRLPSR